MMQSNYVAPEFKKNAFNCPHCNAYAQMVWSTLFVRNENYHPTPASSANCQRCSRPSYWLSRSEDMSVLSFVFSDGIMIYPNVSTAPMPSPDLPENCTNDYLEARDIASRSPRGAAALLRLVLQKLCKHLGGGGEHINTDINWLIENQKLPVRIREIPDLIRLVGNESVHPGDLNLNDTPEIAIELFGLLNFMVDETITRDKKLSVLIKQTPPDMQNKIAGRQQSATPPP